MKNKNNEELRRDYYMTQRENIRQHFANMQSLSKEADIDAYFQNWKQEIGKPSKEEWIESMKAVTELVGELHAQVMQTAPTEQIVVLPSSEEEADFIKHLLQKLHVPFQSKRSEAAKALA